jgi:hypothetical protein
MTDVTTRRMLFLAAEIHKQRFPSITPRQERRKKVRHKERKKHEKDRKKKG